MLCDLHIRCTQCQLHLAGPLSHVISCNRIVNFGDFTVGLNEFFNVGEIQFPTSHLFDFSFESEDDLYIHPQWLEGWRHDWPDFAVGATRRKLHAVASGYGCCGPIGEVDCSCGVQLGCVMADCIGSQWMVFYDSRIDRSDRHDGKWVFHSDAGSPTQWYEDSGELINNRRNGEWERWLVELQFAPVVRRAKGRKLAIDVEERVERQIVALSKWANGRMIDEVTD